MLTNILIPTSIEYQLLIKRNISSKNNVSANTSLVNMTSLKLSAKIMTSLLETVTSGEYVLTLAQGLLEFLLT